MSDTAAIADTAVNAAIIGTMMNQPGRGELADNAEKMRAMNIKDNLGVEPQTMEEYRSEHGGRGWMKAAGWVAGGLAVAAAVVAAAHLMAFVGTALLIGGLAGAVAGSISMGNQANKVREGYDGYLSEVAKEGRALRGQGTAPAQAPEYDNGAGRTQTHAAELEARRQQPAIPGIAP